MFMVILKYSCPYNSSLLAQHISLLHGLVKVFLREAGHHNESMSSQCGAGMNHDTFKTQDSKTDNSHNIGNIHN